MGSAVVRAPTERRPPRASKTTQLVRLNAFSTARKSRGLTFMTV